MPRIARTAAGLAAGALALSLVAAHEGVETNDLVMTGAQEVSTTGDLAAQAVAHVSIPEDDGTAICLELEMRKPLSEGPDAAAGLHVHAGARGEEGPVVVDLTPLLAQADEDGSIDACIDDPTDLAGEAVAGPLLADIVLEGRERFTGEFYLNLHTAGFPAGAIRGQVKGENYRPEDRPAPAAERPTAG